MSSTKRVWLLIAGLVVAALAVAGLSVSTSLSPSKQVTTTRSEILYADNQLALDPEQAVTVTVTGSAVLDPATGYYTYAYSVTNENTSTNVVDAFGLGPIPSPLSSSAPAHWGVYRYAYLGSDSGLVWRVIDTGALPPGYVDTGNVPPSEFDIPIGSSQSGFSFVTPVPPVAGAATFVVQGFDTIQVADPGDDDPQPTFFEIGVTGTTIGPGSPVGIGSGKVGNVLQAPRPNPSRGSAAVGFSLARTGMVELAVYDAQGRLIRTLLSGQRPPGSYSCTWNGRDTSGRLVSPGAYFIRLTVDGKLVGSQHAIQVR
jgi:hypothetical protein